MKSLSPVAPLTSFFEAFLRQHEMKYCEKTQAFFPRSGHSLEYIFKLFQKRNSRKPKVLFPSFFCREVLLPLKDLWDVLSFYTCEDLQNYHPTKEQLKGFDIIVLVDFFGIQRNTKKIHNVTRKNNQWLVLDRTHCFDNTKAKNADFSLYSYHKTYGIPVGACLKVRSPEYIDVSLHQMIVRRKASVLPYLKFFTRSLLRISSRYVHNSFFDESESHYSLDERSLGLLDIAWMKAVRKIPSLQDRSAGNLFNKDLVNALEPNCVCLEETTYLSTFLAKDKETRDTLVRKLQSLGLMPVSWPDLSFGEVFPEDEALKSRLFQLPNHNKMGLNNYLKRIKSDLLPYFKVTSLDPERWEEGSSNYKTPSMAQDNFYLSNRDYLFFSRKLYEIRFKDKRIASLVCFEGPLVEYHNLSPVRPNVDNELLLSLALTAKLKCRNGIKLVRPALKKTPIFYLSKMLPFGKSLGFGGQYSGVLKLIDDPETLKELIDKKWLSELNRAVDLCRDIEIKENQDIDAIIFRYEQFCKAKNFDGIETSSLRHIFEEQGKSVIYSAYKEDEIIGELAIFIHGNTATYLVGMGNNVGRNLNVNYFLLWRAIERCFSMNISFFDLGGFSSQDNGIDHFKRGLRPVEYRTQDFYVCLA